MKYILISILLVMPAAFAAAQDQAGSPLETAFAEGISCSPSDSTFLINADFRFQNLLTFSAGSDDINDISVSGMVRRARLKFDGFVFRPEFQYKLELGLSNRDIDPAIPQGNRASNILLDAVFKWNALDNLSIWFGQTKLPGNRERVISSQQLQFVDRSLLNGEYNIDRDWGIQVHHQFKLGKIVFRDIYAVSRGEGRNITTDNNGGLSYTARLEILPFGSFTDKGDYVGSDIYREEKPKLSLAASYDYNDDTERSGGQLGSFLPGTADLATLFADMMFKYRGFSVMAEYAGKNADRLYAYDKAGMIAGQFVEGQGVNVQAGYLFKNNYELAGRYTQINPTSDPDIFMYTLGVSRYIVGHNLKWQADVSLIETGLTATDEYLARFQVEVAF